MKLFNKLKKDKNKEFKQLITNSILDIIIYTLIFLIIFVLIIMALKSIFNITDSNVVINNYKVGLTNTINNAIYIAIISIIISISSFIIYICTIISSFKSRLINKNNYKKYTNFMIIMVLILNTIAAYITTKISLNRISRVGSSILVGDLSFYNIELSIYNRLYLGLALNYAIWTFITILICAILIKYVYNKKIVIKETKDKKLFLSKLFKRSKKKK